MSLVRFEGATIISRPPTETEKAVVRAELRAAKKAIDNDPRFDGFRKWAKNAAKITNADLDRGLR